MQSEKKDHLGQARTYYSAPSCVICLPLETIVHQVFINILITEYVEQHATTEPSIHTHCHNVDSHLDASFDSMSGFRTQIINKIRSRGQEAKERLMAPD